MLTPTQCSHIWSSKMFAEVTKQHWDLRTEISTGTSSTLYSTRSLHVHTSTVRKTVFEPRTSTRSETFSLLTCLDATKFVSRSAFTLMETIRRRIWAKPMPKNSSSVFSLNFSPAGKGRVMAGKAQDMRQRRTFLWGGGIVEWGTWLDPCCEIFELSSLKRHSLYFK